MIAAAETALKARPRVLSISALAFCLALAFQALNAGMSAAFLPFPSQLDEWQHLSFVRWMEIHPTLFPRYEQMHTLAPDGLGWAGHAWISHPAPYYLILAAIDSVAHSVLVLRLANAALALGGVALMLIAGFRVLTNDAERAIFAAVVVSYPKLGIVAGLINNDNFAMLAVGLGFLALVRRQQRPGGWLMAFALALAGWSKLTVFLTLGFGFVFAELMSLRLPGRAHLPILGGGLLGALPTIVNLRRYGSIVWHGAQPVHWGPPISLPQYLGRSFRQLASTWSALEPSSAVALLGLVLVLGLGLYAALRGWRTWPAAAGLIAALFPVLLLQLWFGWDEAVRYGFQDQLQARYYYGVWPGFALALASLWSHVTGPTRVVLAGVTGACLGMSSASFCIVLVLASGGALR